MRFNTFGAVARDHRGSAVATWLTDTHVAYQQPKVASKPSGPWEFVERYPDGATSALTADGANAWATGGSQWVSRYDKRLRPLQATRPVFADDGRVGDVSRDGVVATMDEARTQCLVVSPDGVATLFGIALFGELRLWTYDGEPAVAFTGPNVTVELRERTGETIPCDQWPKGYAATALDVDGVIWVLYQTDAYGLVLHTSTDRTRGYIFGRPQSIYNPDIIQLPNGDVRVGWSVDPGEFNVQTTDIRLGLNMVNIGGVVPPAPTPIPPQPPTPMPPTPTPTPPPMPQNDILRADEFLYPDDMLTSSNGAYVLRYQLDGNVVLYRTRDDKALWATNTSGDPDGFFLMQTDGNAVLYAGGEPAWASGTEGAPGAYLIVQNDGNVVVYDATGMPLWATNTAGGGAPTPLPPVPGPTPQPPSPPVPPLPPMPPGPPSGNPNARVGASYYVSATNPLCDPVEFALRLSNLGVGFTRTWLLDAWAVEGGGPGTYHGFLPVNRRSDNRFDLNEFNAAYFGRLQDYTMALNARRIIPQFTLLELYAWSERKAGNLWVPDPNRGPYRNNVNGVRWGDPDDRTFGAPPYEGQGLPDAWFSEFIGRTVEALGTLDYTFEIGNEMPEKPLHHRLKARARAAGYAGPLQVNRNEDTPGQYFNMRIGKPDGFDTIALHGMRDLGYLDVEYPREAEVGRPTTLRAMWRHADIDPARITLSSDGCRKTTNVEDAYDYPRLLEVAQDTLRRGASYEHQLAMKLRLFTEGRLRLDDIEQFDGAFLRGLQR